MSDYIAGLRGDLVEAAARHQARGALSRRTVPLRPRAWSRPALAAALAAAACVAAVVVAVRAIGPPAAQPARPHVVATVRLGGPGGDAVYAAGSLWVADTNGILLRVDPRRRKVVRRIRVGESAGPLTGDGRAIFVTAVDNRGNGRLLRVDPRTLSVRRWLSLQPDPGPVALADGVLWVVPNIQQSQILLLGFDPVTGRSTATIRADFRNSLAGAGGVLWALSQTGSLAEIDAASGRIVARVPGVAETLLQAGTLENSTVADAGGAWVAGGTLGQVVRVVAGNVVRRIPVGGTVATLARTRGALWASVEEGTPTRYRVVRIDPESGRVTGSVGLGYRHPRALVPAGRELWVVASDGTATVIRG